MEIRMDAKRSFKPGESITLTLVFTEPLDASTSLTVEYSLDTNGSQAADAQGQSTFQKWFVLTQQHTSEDRKQTVLSGAVAAHQAAGTYLNASIAAEKPGARRQEVPLPGVPTITIENSERDDLKAQIPAIKDISLGSK